MAGLLNLDDPNSLAMLQFGLGLLQAGGYSPQRTSLGQAIGGAGQGAVGAYTNARQQQIENQRRQEMLEMQRKLQASQIAENEAQMQARQAAVRRQAEMDAGFKSVIQQPYMGAEQGPPIPPELARPVFDRNAYEQWLAQYKPDEFVKLQLQREKPDTSKLPSDYQNFLLAKASGYDKEFFDYQKELRQAGAINIPQSVVPTQDANGNWVYGVPPTRGGGKAVVTDLTAPTPSSERAPQLKPIPPSIKKAAAETKIAMRSIDEAIAAIDTAPENSFGLARANWLGQGENINQRLDPKGVNARSKVSNIGSLKIHDRSGAAVSVHEYPRLAPFIPQITDTKDTIKQKLKNLRREYEMMDEYFTGDYSPDMGYGAPTKQSTAPRGAAPKSNAADPLGIR